MTWTDERVSRLCKMWLGWYTSEDIAKEMGLSRNAVVGKIHRLGLTRDGMDSDIVEARRQRHREHCRRSWAAKRGLKLKPLPKVIGPAPVAGKKTLMELGPKECRWPYGDGPFLFCAETAIEGKSYCAAHCRKAMA